MAAFTSAPGQAVPGLIWPDSPDPGIVSVPTGDVSGTTVEAATVLVVATTDPGTGGDVVSTRTVPPDTDAGAGADLSTVRVFDGDTGTGTDLVNTRTVVADTDGATGADLATVRVFVTTDPGSGLDSGAAFNTAVDNDPATGLDIATVRVFDGDLGSGTDAVNVRTIPTTSDTGAGLDTAVIDEAGNDTYGGLDSATVLVLAGTDPGSGLDLAPQPIVVTFGIDSGTGLDVATILVASNDTGGSSREFAFVGIQGALDSHLRTYLVDPDVEAALDGDPDNRSWTSDPDPTLHMGDGVVGAGSNRTILCEVEQFVDV